MNISRVSNCSFKGVYIADNLDCGKQHELGRKVREALVSSGVADVYEKTENKDMLIKKAPNGGVTVAVEKIDPKRLRDDDYMNTSNCSFKGVYLANNLDFGHQYELGKKVREALVASGVADAYEKDDDEDMLIKKGPNGGVTVALEKHDIKRILDDDYSRWNGRF